MRIGIALELPSPNGPRVVLDHVELRSEGPVVLLTAPDTEETRRMDADFDAAHGGGWAPDSGQRPAVTIFRRIRVAVRDDVGTEYRPRQLAIADETPWSAQWRFRPPVPESASALTIEVTAGEAPPVTHSIDLRNGVR